MLATAKSASGLVEDEVRQPAEADNTKSWYINGQGQTMVILHGPVQFMMGSPADEKDHQSDETLRPKGILRSFAIAGKAVTVAEFKRFAPAFSHSQIQRSPEPTCPILGVTWYEAAAYCNWSSKQEGIPEGRGATNLTRRDNTPRG